MRVGLAFLAGWGFAGYLGGEGLAPGFDGVAAFDELAGCLAHAVAEGGVGGEAMGGGGPLFGRVGEEAGLAVADHFEVDADRVGNHRQPGCHVLEYFQAALPSAPVIVGQDADSKIAACQISHFG